MNTDMVRDGLLDVMEAVTNTKFSEGNKEYYDYMKGELKEYIVRYVNVSNSNDTIDSLEKEFTDRGVNVSSIRKGFDLANKITSVDIEVFVGVLTSMVATFEVMDDEMKNVRKMNDIENI